LSGFERGQIIGAHLAGASVTKTATLLEVSQAAVSKVILAYTYHVKTAQQRGTVGEKQHCQKEIIEHSEGLLQKNIPLLQHR
jgi:predicted transcriptional regulator